MMKMTIGLLVAVIAWTPGSALACLGVFAESYFVTSTPPASAATDAVTLKVSLAETPDPVKRFWDSKPIKATVIAVVHGSYAGKTIMLTVPPLSSCDRLAPFRDVKAPITGFVTGVLSKDAAGHVVLMPRSRRPAEDQPH